MKDKTPKIRFKGFTDDWEQRKLGDYGSVAMCKRVFKNQTNEKHGIPFYKIGTFGGEADSYISKELFNKYRTNYSFPNKGEILLSASGSIGRIVEYSGKDEYFQDSNIVWFKHDKQLYDRFLKYVYSNVKWAGIEGSTIKRLYNDNILKTDISIPSISEQTKIGTFFQSLDNLITLHQRKCEKLKNIKKSMLQKMFPKNGEKFPEVRFAGFTDAWEQRKLGEEAQEIIAGGDIEKTKIVSQGRYPVIANALTNEGIVGFYLNSYRVKAPAVTVTGRGDVGHAKARFCDFTPVVRLLTVVSKHNPYFLENAINNHSVIIESTGVPQLTVPQLALYAISFPNKLEEQTKIGTFFQSLDNLITLHQRKVEKLQNVKKSMLERMFV